MKIKHNQPTGEKKLFAKNDNKVLISLTYK